MVTVSKHSTHCNPFLHLKRFLYGDDPLKNLSDFYNSVKECRRRLTRVQASIDIKKQTTHDPLLWRIIESELDDLLIGDIELAKTEQSLDSIFEYMGNNGMIGGTR